jgi:hypothetical protein
MATAITDYASLKTAISEWFMGRDMSADVDVFIDLAESYFNAKLRTRQMETKTDLTPSSGECTLPTDYIEYKRVVELASIRRRLAYITEDAAENLYPTRSAGLANHFMILGSTLTALPISGNDIELTYYQKIPALSDSNTTNWLLSEHPNLYLHASLLYCAKYVVDEPMMMTESTFVQNYVDLIHAADNRGKFANAGVTLPGVNP